MQLPNNAISATDAARIIGISAMRLREKMREGKIKGIKIKKYWYVDLDSLKEYINRNGSRRSEEVMINGEHAIPLSRFCEIFGLIAGSANRLIQDGKIRVVKLNGANYITDSEIERYKCRYEVYNGRKIIYISEAAKRLKCSVDAVKKHIDNGELEKVKIGAKVFVYADSLERLTERLTVGKKFLSIPKGRIRRAAVIERMLMDFESGEKW